MRAYESGDFVDRKIIFKFFLEALIDPLSLFLLYLGLRLGSTLFDSRPTLDILNHYFTKFQY